MKNCEQTMRQTLPYLADSLAAAIVLNPVCQGREQLPGIIKNLERAAGKSVHVIETVKDGYEENNKHIRSQIPSNVGVLAVASGDGTLNMLSQILTAPETSDVLRNSVILPIPAGTECDTARAMNGSAELRDPGNILLNGRVRKANLVEAILSNNAATAGDKPERIVINSYCTGGTSGQVAKGVNTRWYLKCKEIFGKPGHTILGRLVAAENVLTSRGFTVTDTQGEREVVEWGIVNGPRMAGARRFPEVSHWEKETFQYSVIADPLSIAVGAVRYAVKPFGYLTDQPTSVTIHEPTYWQVDGEVFFVEPETTLAFQPAKHTLNILSL